jgi:hypothetical protein
METLESLAKFVGKYPQKEGKWLKYAFLGGTAVRLHQQASESESYRPISDFDLLVFGEPRYPVHSFTPSQFLSGTPLRRRDLFPYVTKVSPQENGQNYYVMDGAFLALTKTCAIDCPREKDFDDLASLYDLGIIDLDKLNALFSKADRVTKNSDLVLDTFEWFFSGDRSPEKVKLFQSFPRLANLLDEFSDKEHPSYLERVHDIRDSLVNFSRNYSGNGYALSSVLYDTHALLRELDNDSRKDTKLLGIVLSHAARNDYRDFSETVHHKLIPGVRYAPEGNKGKCLKDLIKTSSA